ncbi:MAG: hypothetical protein AAB865_02365 [Patescibacteria group bacterium]
MDIKQLLAEGRGIWGDRRLTIEEMIVRHGVGYGDLCRWARNAPKDAGNHTDAELKKEMGNMIFSTIRWCDDLGYDPEECIQLAIACQKKFATEEKV